MPKNMIFANSFWPDKEPGYPHVKARALQVENLHIQLRLLQ